ncbi:hypothetical protein A0H81_02939 [Grifola frondosa]|uniref:Uncharacterized protein n=1 Tax=Grifola frondosa TaxID=5627 RepID=A0A1C7MHJ3_GRIFR|nr:hypothetical protein A0H81_02939 [Grifola frondosa]
MILLQNPELASIGSSHASINHEGFQNYRDGLINTIDPCSAIVEYLRSFLILVVAIFPALSAATCQWFGTAPFCAGECEGSTSRKLTYGYGGGGNGAVCVSGSKAFCCDPSSSSWKGCQWYGTAPICAGECPPGKTQVTTDGSGDGASCVSGNKVFCCNSANSTSTAYIPEATGSKAGFMIINDALGKREL